MSEKNVWRAKKETNSRPKQKKKNDMGAGLTCVRLLKNPSVDCVKVGGKTAYSASA